MGVAWFDFNDDGWLDLYVANDSGPNFLYENQKDGTFKEIGFPMGVAVSEDGGEQGSMGVAVGDYDHSGRFSLYVTNFAEEYYALYHNEGTPLHRRLVPLEDGACEPALRGLGHRVLRLRQRRLGGPDRGERPRLSATGQVALRRRRRLSAAQAALPQPRRRQLRRGGRALRAGAYGGAREPRPRGRRPGQRRPARRGDQRPRRKPPGPPQRARRAPATGCS